LSDIFRDQRRRDSDRAASRPATFESIRKTQSIFDRYSQARNEAGRPKTVIAWPRVAAALVALAVVTTVLALGVVKLAQSGAWRWVLGATAATAILASACIWIRRRRRGSPAGKDQT
jgi:hypothetical protein